jgi:hypothetical protein
MRTERHEPVGFIIHICMEPTQGNSIYLKLAKTSRFSFYLSCFFFHNIGEQEGRTGSTGGVWEGWT